MRLEAHVDVGTDARGAWMGLGERAWHLLRDIYMASITRTDMQSKEVGLTLMTTFVMRSCAKHRSPLLHHRGLVEREVSANKCLR